MPTITDLLVPWHLSQWTFAFILNYTTSHCFFWNILAWLWQLYQLLLHQLLLSTYIVPHKLKHTHINTSQVSQPTCYFELEDLTTKKHTQTLLSKACRKRQACPRLDKHCENFCVRHILVAGELLLEILSTLLMRWICQWMDRLWRWNKIVAREVCWPSNASFSLYRCTLSNKFRICAECFFWVLVYKFCQTLKLVACIKIQQKTLHNVNVNGLASICAVGV